MTFENIVKNKYLNQKSLHQKPGSVYTLLPGIFMWRNLQQNFDLVNSITNQWQNMHADRLDTHLR